MKLGLRSAAHHAAALPAASLGLGQFIRQRPAACDYHAALKLADAAPDALGNDKYGDCVPAGNLRLAQIRVANAEGSSWRPTAAQAVALYTAWSGFDPATGQPDDGTDLAVAQALAARDGINLGLDLDVPLPVSVPLDPDAIDAAIWAFGGVAYCWALPSYLMDADPFQTWDVLPGGITAPGAAPGSAGQHFTPGARYGAERTVITWGVEVEVAPAFTAAYLIGVAAQLSRRWFDTKGLNIPGWDWAQADAIRRVLAA